MPDYGTNLALFAPSGFPQLGVLIRREFQPYAAPPVRNRVIEGLPVFEVHHVAAPLRDLDQFAGIRNDDFSRKDRH
jgi:hypothetical protein